MTENEKHNRSKQSLRLIAICGIFAAFVFIGTELRIPTAIGYMNLGDAVILQSLFSLLILFVSRTVIRTTK